MSDTSSPMLKNLTHKVMDEITPEQVEHGYILIIFSGGSSSAWIDLEAPIEHVQQALLEVVNNLRNAPTEER